MDQSATGTGQLSVISKDLARRLLTIGGNRLELLAAEVREERGRLLQTLLLALGMGVFGLLAGMTLTAGIVWFFWDGSPSATFVLLAALYVAAAMCIYYKLAKLMRGWKSFAGTVDQLRKDGACLETFLH